MVSAAMEMKGIKSMSIHTAMLRSKNRSLFIILINFKFKKGKPNVSKDVP